MKKFIMLFLFLISLVGFSKINSQTVNYSCPSGDEFRCVYISDVLDIWKGPGDSTHKINTQ